MTDHEHDLLDEQELCDALAELRPDAGEFGRGLSEKIAAKVDAAPAVDPRLPRWVKRAAAVLPPGFTELALLGKAGGKAGGVLLGPWAVIALGFAGIFGAFGATRRLDASAVDAPDAAPAKLFQVAAALVFAAILAAWVFAAFIPDPITRSLVTGGLVLGAILAVTLTLSAAGLADRERVGSTLIVVLIQASLFLAILDRGDGSLGTALAPPLLAAFSIPIAILLDRTTRRSSQMRRRRMPGALFFPGLLLVMSLLSVAIHGTRFGTSERELVSFAERVDVSQLYGFTTLGRVARAVEPEALAGLDRDRLRKRFERAMADDEALLATYPAAALRLGVLPPEAWDNKWLKVSTRSTSPHIRRLRDRDEVIVKARALKRDGRWDDAERAASARLIRESWPEPGSKHSIEIAAACVALAGEIGDRALTAELAGRVGKVVAGAWVGTRVPGTSAVGFDIEFDEWPSGHPHSRIDTTLEAVFLMRRFGVPESVDLRRLDDYLSREMRSRDHDDVAPRCVIAAVARLVLRRDIGVPPLSVSQWVLRELAVVIALVGGALAMWATWRAPVS